MTFAVDETISAIATPVGEAGLAIIRIAGPEALNVASRIFRQGSRRLAAEEFQSHRVYVGKVFDDEELIDEVVLTIFRSPKSYTGDDSAEFTCHGGQSVPSRILTVTLQNGCRMAQAGEFTKRAFLRGRLDLTQAEAVAELIHSNSEAARVAATRQLEGSLKHRISDLRSQALNCLAQVEGTIDFPDDEIDSGTNARLRDALTSITASLNELAGTKEDSRILRDGVRAAIIGLPNTGKSSLFNALLGSERAIVSATPGTTRDTIEELMSIEGTLFRLIDTAGVRESSEGVELEGIERAQRARAAADLVILVLELGRPVATEETALLSAIKRQKHLVVLNKSDLDLRSCSLPAETSEAISVSAKTGFGIDSLKRSLVNLSRQGRRVESSIEFLTNSRHQEAIGRTLEHLGAATEALEANQPIELVASDLRRASNSLGEITGLITTDDILDSIFSRFCIGK